MYSVDEYLDMLTAADRAPKTIVLYRQVFRSYAAFLAVPVEEIHNHLLPESLIKYAAAMKGHSGKSIKMRLSVLRGFFQENGVTFSGMEIRVLKAPRKEDHDDKPLALLTLQKMVDLANPHLKAMIVCLISTGMRPGELVNIKVNNVAGDRAEIPNEIAKGKRGGLAYLTAEAREFLDLWLKERDTYITRADAKAQRLGHPRPARDERLFAISYSAFHGSFTRLYRLVDGEKGKYRARITPHSCRRYFRTNAVKSMGLDVVEKILRHEGYLTGSYVRLTDEETRRAFHAGEDVLYITRRDRRQSEGAIAQIKAEKDELAMRVDLLEKIVKHAGKRQE
jgi:integrase